MNKAVRLYAELKDLEALNLDEMAQALGCRVVDRGRVSMSGPGYVDVEPIGGNSSITVATLRHYPISEISSAYPLR